MIIEPWYRQFWPWFLFGLPGIVVVAGLTTWWIAARHADHLVVDDYYKEGLAINRELGKEQRALELGILATLERDAGMIRATLQASNMPAALQLLLSHPMDANKDVSLPLAQVRPGVFEATLELEAQHNWYWRLEPIGLPPQEHWRVDGELTVITANGY